MRAAKRRGARIGRSQAAVDQAALVHRIRFGASVAKLARRLGASRPTVRKLMSAAVEKRVSAGGAHVEAITHPGDTVQGCEPHPRAESDT
ncbi:MAG TPA: hypothetical protein VKM54_20990 [Myxococcota bacterium]|nr:hypothetical protein [Myxococcota bacterium]